MEPYLIAIIVIASIVVAAVALLFILAVVCHKMGFSSRCDKNPLLSYFDGKHFELPERDVSIVKGKTVLRGKLYGEPSDKIILFCHGLGAGHIAYTTEIAYLCKTCAQVLAVDYEGCNLSDGKNIRGMYSGAECVIAAIKYVKSNAEFKGKKIWLIGHSWGGYSALCAAQRERVDGVIAISAPDNPAETLYCAAAQIIGRPLSLLLKPFWRLINFLKFGKFGNASASRELPDGVPVMLVHGDNDNVVPLKFSAFSKSKGKNVRKLLCNGKSHNPYNSENAQNLLIELAQTLVRVGKMTETEKREYFRNFDFAAATEEDSEVMEEIVNFIKLS